MTGRVTVNLRDETWARLQKIATPFRPSERGTPDKVIGYLLDEHDERQAELASHPDADRPPGTSGSWGEQ